ncbi:MAG TPA: TlpA disulfide reductase family protein [Candidatus Baltobacteraceae bacterium]
MRSILFLVIGTLAAVVVIAIVGGYFGERGEVAGAGGGPAMLAGAPAASYPVQRVDGTADSLDNYRGHVVLVNLWATWCTPCRDEMPALENLYRRDRSRGLVVLGIDQGEAASVAGAYAQKVGVDYPILIDEAQRYGGAYEAVGLPTSVIVDRSGHIVRGIDGPLTLAQMHDVVEPALR